MSTPVTPGKVLFETLIQPFWSDHDEAGHINNVEYFRYCEEARIRWMNAGGMSKRFRKEGQVVIGSTTMRYLREWFHTEPLRVTLTLERLGNSSLTLNQLLSSEDGALRVAESEVTMVCFDTQTRKSTPFPQYVRDALLGN